MTSGKTKPLVFFGTEDFSLITLRKLVESGFTIGYVVTKPDTQKGRGHKLQAPAVKPYAETHNIPVLQPKKLSEITDIIKSLDHPTGILVSYGKIIPDSVLSLFKPGIINIHPSLLPKYRGPSPIEASVLSGDTLTGVSIMKLDQKMDTGPIYSQQEYEMDDQTSVDHMYSDLGAIGADLLVKILPDIISGELQPIEQNNAIASYCHIINKSDGIINWNKPASEIEREIRAYANWPQSRTRLGSVDAIITHSNTTQMKSGEPGEIAIDKSQLFVSTGTDLLEITSLKPLGKKEMTSAAFLAGYRAQLK